MLETILDLLAKPEFQTIVVSAIAFIFGLVKKMQFTKKWKLGVAANAIEVGVIDTFESYVRVRKAGWADGKLTDDERREARSIAINVAIDFARDKGLDIVKFYGKEYLPVLIEKFILKNKIAAGLAKPFLDPELPLQ